MENIAVFKNNSQNSLAAVEFLAKELGENSFIDELTNRVNADVLYQILQEIANEYQLNEELGCYLVENEQEIEESLLKHKHV